MRSETCSFVLEVPILEDETVDAVHTFLLDLLTQYENHYFAQLHRHQQTLNSMRREPIEEAQRRAAPPEPHVNIDDELNDDIPF